MHLGAEVTQYELADTDDLDIFLLVSCNYFDRENFFYCSGSRPVIVRAFFGNGCEETPSRHSCSRYDPTECWWLPSVPMKKFS